MIELEKDQLVCRFPEVHPRAELRIEFQRTLRIPDDRKTYPLPPGLGRFPVRHVDDFAARVPEPWIEHGGVMLPMYQSEALWLNFRGDYPFAIRVATGKIDAVTGKELRPVLARRPQNYLVAPSQPWLDGYCVEKGVIRQFVAMPLGAGYSAEEQITGKAEHGGLQLVVCPMTGEAYDRIYRKFDHEGLARDGFTTGDFPVMARMRVGAPVNAIREMGLAPGGRMRQEIVTDPYHLEDWDQDQTSRCFVHLANSMVWRHITGHEPPTVPPTAREYSAAGLPWFEYYGAGEALGGSSILAKLKSVVQMGAAKGDVPLPENESVHPATIVALRGKLGKNEVREGAF